MRLFTITDTTSPFKLVAVDSITVMPDMRTADVRLSYWRDYDYYIRHGNDFTPLSSEVVRLELPSPPQKILDFIYYNLAARLPAHEVIYSRPRE